MRRASVIILALTFAACDGEKPGDGVLDDSTVQNIGSCADLESHIEQQAIREMNAQIDQIIDSLNDKSARFANDAVSPSAAPPMAERGTSATDFTTTNTQEAGVDEPDFVKNDGSRIFVLHGRSLVSIAAWPPESARIESTTTLDGTPQQMLLHKNTLVVFSMVSLNLGVSGRVANPASSYLLPYPPHDSLKVTVLDVSTATPRVIHEQYLEGRFLDARRTDTSVRVVTGAGRRGPELRYWPEGDYDWSNRASMIAALEKLRRENVRVIKDAPLSDWLPRLFEPGAGQGPQEVKRECSSFFASNVPARLGFTTVTTLDLNGLAVDHTTLLNEADEVYASHDALYLATRHYWFSRPSESQVREDHTYLFKFNTGSDPRHVHFAASGGVPGHIVNQFALDEEAGHLRVATTRQTFIGWRMQNSTNSVFVLRASGGKLERVGELTGLAHNERIFSARFEGPRGFLVTFRNIDPLFTLDLSNPASPQVVGELKIPGFSTYLHPISRDHLLTIGRDTSGAQLQVFDVSNFASPSLMHRYVLGSRSSSSEAEYDHKAFTYFGSRALLAIPFSDWSLARASRFSSTLEVLRVTPAQGIQPMGSIEHTDLVQGTNNGRYFGWTPQVRRSVMMDDYVYSISYGGAKVHDTRDLSRPIATMAFPVAR
jgi:hypothetical protein